MLTYILWLPYFIFYHRRMCLQINKNNLILDTLNSNKIPTIFWILNWMIKVYSIQLCLYFIKWAKNINVVNLFFWSIYTYCYVSLFWFHIYTVELVYKIPNKNPLTTHMEISITSYIRTFQKTKYVFVMNCIW